MVGRYKWPPNAKYSFCCVCIILSYINIGHFNIVIVEKKKMCLWWVTRVLICVGRNTKHYLSSCKPNIKWSISSLTIPYKCNKNTRYRRVAENWMCSCNIIWLDLATNSARLRAKYDDALTTMYALLIVLVFVHFHGEFNKN